MKLFGRKQKESGKVRCYICGIEVPWSEFREHMKAHIKNGKMMRYPARDIR